MGRTYDYETTYKHEGYVEHQRTDGTWTGGLHDNACTSNGTFRAACECGWRGQTTAFAARDKYRGWCFLPEAEEDRVMEDWETHMRPLVRVAKVSEADDAATRANEALRTEVWNARCAGASWSDVGSALGVTKQAAQQRFGGTA